jgi:exodeoxyribonuclease VII large subunit
LKVMQRGYSLVYDENKKNLIKSIAQVQLGDIVNITLKDGRMDCHIWAVEEISNGQD